ncbi:MAG: hypothetical protein FWC33_03345 [Candidatus Bathyarchaeota archaeon]|nr:hypothetical protein [Candidatus Termiticorpusculum sp.]
MNADLVKSVHIEGFGVNGLSEEVHKKRWDFCVKQRKERSKIVMLSKKHLEGTPITLEEMDKLFDMVTNFNCVNISCGVCPFCIEFPINTKRCVFWLLNSHSMKWKR